MWHWDQVVEGESYPQHNKNNPANVLCQGKVSLHLSCSKHFRKEVFGVSEEFV